MEKTCRHCGQSKPVSEFHKDRSKSDGLNAYCKACHIARQREYDMRPPRIAVPEGLKRCEICKQNKPPEQFYKQKGMYDGLSKRCIECAKVESEKWRKKNLKRAAVHAKKWRADNPERAKDHDLKRHYGLPLGTYAKMLEAQNGCCAICGTNTPNGHGRFHLDHCHDRGNVRGLLCASCNVGIGHFHHDPDILIKAIKYLAERGIKSAG